MKLLLRTGRSLLAATFISISLLSQAQDIKQLASEAKVTPDLLNVQLSQNAAPTPPIGGFQVKTRYQIDGNRVAIEAVATDQNGGALLQQLLALGLQNALAYKGIVFGYLPIDQIDDLKNISTLAFARPAYKPQHNTGSVTSQGDQALKADVARTTYSVTGAGSKVGVISDSYNALGGGPAGVGSGDLPANVQVLDDDLTVGNTDEGRAMAEIVHDVAPGADIAFNTANRGQAGFAQGIKDLANAGCNIIVDDIIYFFEPFFQDGVIAQAVDEVVSTKNVTYFSAAGNQARSSYESTYKPYSSTVSYGVNRGTPHVFSGTDVRQTITVPAGGEVFLIFQWDSPFQSVSGAPGAQTDMDLLVLIGGTYYSAFSGISNNIGGDPIEFIDLVNSGSTPASLEVVLVKRSGPDPTYIKYVNYGSNLTIEYDTKSGTSLGHNNSSLGIGVGAAPFSKTPAFDNTLTTAVVEPFSSAGGTPVFLTPTGTRINGNTGVIRQQPQITSVDGGNTTFFYADSNIDTDALPNFFGTSAAAPHAAAVAALLQEKTHNSLSPATIGSILKQTALDMDDPSTPGFDTGFDYGTGYGFIQADKALQSIAPPPGIFAITGVTTVSCATVTAGQRTLVFTPQYSGVNSQPISFSVVNELLPTANPGPYTLNIYTDNPVITLKATQTGTPLEASFAYNWLEACGTGNPPTPPSGSFDITGVTTVSCATVAAGQRTLVFTPQYSGLTGQPISFSVVNELLPTTNPGPYTLNIYTDNPVITLKATQAGSPNEASFTYNWLVACGYSASHARLGSEPGSGLAVQVLGNPVGETADLKISGGTGQLIQLELTDVQGRVLHQHTINDAKSVEMVSLPMSGRKGLLLLQVGTSTERKIIKLIKP